MTTDLKISLLSENTTYKNGILAEHGLSYFIETAGRKILFDTGQLGIIAENAKNMGLTLEKIDAIILSHGHYDHTGGLKNLKLEGVTIYGHPDIFIRRYSVKKGGDIKRESGIPLTQIELENRGAVIKLSKEPVHVYGINTTGEVPRITDFEKVPDTFLTEENKKDNILDDLSIYIETPKGIVVLLGCCHSGIVNTLTHISNLTGEYKYYLVMGGTHLMSASKEQITRTINELERFNIEYISTLHCTGPVAKNEFMNRYKDRFLNVASGDTIEIQF